MIVVKIEQIGEEYTETIVEYDSLSEENKAKVVRGILNLTV